MIPIKPNKVLIMGGIDEDEKVSDKIYTYKFDSGSKNSKAIDLPEGIFSFSGVTVGEFSGQFYAFFPDGNLLHWNPDLKALSATIMNYD